MNQDVLNDLAELCYLKGVRHAVLCPGSRSAPLTLAFTGNKKITCWTFSDERSAAFVAVGMARQTKTPVVLVCTSGSAAYNFAPAVAEAFFQQVPLVVFTADRPHEWIDQYDGQTIRQPQLYGRHVKQFYELPTNDPHPDASWHTNRIVNEAINLSQGGLNGPVHINAPFREPLYPAPVNQDRQVKAPRVINRKQPDHDFSTGEWEKIASDLNAFEKVLVVAGQQDSDESLINVLNGNVPWPVVGDILSNLHPLPIYCRHTDTFLGQAPDAAKEDLRPDLLITFGKSLVAKNLKIFLRKYSPKEHWHLQLDGETADTFKALTRILPVAPSTFFTKAQTFQTTRHDSWQMYLEAWAVHEEKAKKSIQDFFAKKDGEFHCVKKVLEALPARCNLHLANSMSVRYANHIGLKDSQKEVSVYANRGTSGIDGCSSTAVGQALTSDVPNILVTGDLAFFYDRNAFWHNYELPNLFILVLNNHGGIIFNLIDGPAGLPEADEYFITNQRLGAKALAQEFGFEFHDAVKADLKTFFNSTGKAKILEFESTQSQSKEIFESFRNQIKKSYET